MSGGGNGVSAVTAKIGVRTVFVIFVSEAVVSGVQRFSAVRTVHAVGVFVNGHPFAVRTVIAGREFSAAYGAVDIMLVFVIHIICPCAARCVV